MANLNTRTILANRFTQAVFNRTLVTYRGHIDKVDNDQAAEVAQAQLAGDFVSRFQVGVEGGLFDVAAAGCARGVDIDSGQGFSGVDNNRAAGRQTHFTLESGLDLRLNLIVAEQRDFTGVQFNFAAEIRAAQCGDMLARQFEHFRVVDQDFADVLAQIVTESTHNHVALLVDQERGRAAVSGFLYGVPVLQAETEIPLQRIGLLANARGAYDQAHAVWQLKCRKGFFQFGAVVTLDAA